MKILNRYFVIYPLAVFALTASSAMAQLDPRNLTPQQQRVFETRLKQKGIEVDYNKLSADEKERYFRLLRQDDQKRQQAKQGQRQQSGQTQNPNANNPYNKTLIPLTDFGDKTYQGLKGGLYPNGENTRPKAHTEAGLAIAKNIKPLDRNGNVDEKNGKIVWLSIGMSNTTQETGRFLELMKNYPNKKTFFTESCG